MFKLFKNKTFKKICLYILAFITLASTSFSIGYAYYKATVRVGKFNLTVDGVRLVTPVDKQGNVSSDSYYVAFGYYPQSNVTDSMENELNAAFVSTLPTEGQESTSDGWVSYKAYSSGVPSDYMWYKDVVHNNKKYRGVYFTKYIPQIQTSAANTNQGLQYNSGYDQIGKVYWFLFEPIIWKIIHNENGIITLFSNKVIDSNFYYHNKDNRTINGTTIYPSNYEHSDIRAFLNGHLFNSAFGNDEKNVIQTTSVDNSKNSTYSSVNEIYCGNTTYDKVYLLSYSDTLNYNKYGFHTSRTSDLSDTKTQSTRLKEVTDYSQIRGVSKVFVSGSTTSNWWLRSPGYNNRYSASYVSSKAQVYYGGNECYYSQYGIVPVINIKFDL